MNLISFLFSRCAKANEEVIPHIDFFEYFLPLFPVFTLSTSFPIIAISLTNNLKTIFQRSKPLAEMPIEQLLRDKEPKSFFRKHILFPLLAVIPPALVSVSTEDLETLVGIVGSYAGATIQYVIPATLIYYGRKYIKNLAMRISGDSELTGYDQAIRERFVSPFKHMFWIYFVNIWALLCIILITVNYIYKAVA